MKTEISAGGVVVSFQKNIWYVLVIYDGNNNWTFPKGIIEKDELQQAASEREITEETGVDQLSLIQPLNEIEYFFTRGEKIHKKVIYYLYFSTVLQIPIPQTSEGITRVQWVPFTDAFSLVGYKETNLPLLHQVKKILETYNYS